MNVAAPGFQEFQIAPIPSDRQLRQCTRHRRRCARERLLVRGLRHSRHAVCGFQRLRLEARGDQAARAAPEIGMAVRAGANRSAPLTHPRVLVVEHERDVEALLQHRAEKRRVRRVDRDEHRVERLARQDRRCASPQAAERSHPEVAKSETTAQRGRPRARVLHANAWRDARGERRIEPPFVVARVDGQDRRLPPMGGHVRREQAQPMRRRRAVRRKVRADAQDAGVVMLIHGVALRRSAFGTAARSGR